MTYPKETFVRNVFLELDPTHQEATGEALSNGLSTCRHCGFQVKLNEAPPAESYPVGTISFFKGIVAKIEPSAFLDGEFLLYKKEIK